MSLAIGETVAGYTILRLLGSGGMGEVYLAKHPRLPRQDALKVLHPEATADDNFRQRFTQEADLTATLMHPNIVAVHDTGEVSGRLWIASQYVEGLDAAQLLQESYPDGMPVDMVSAIVSAIASALDYAHEQGLLHRDVKPANILLGRQDRTGRRHAYLTDFGIARSLTEANGLTATNMTVGTFAYSPPEQLLGEGMSERTDQYALAATTYHLLTGSTLFPTSNAAVVINHQLNTPPPALADSHPELAILDKILHVGLAKQADNRFQCCGDFARALADQVDSALLPQNAIATTAGPTPKAANATKRLLPTRLSVDQKHSLAKVLVTASLASALVIGGALLAWQPWEGRENSSDPAKVVADIAIEATQPPTAHNAAEAIKTMIPEVTRIIDLTESTDDNHLLGRPNGYSAATVLVDSRTTCDPGSPGTSCGATIEQWPDGAAAQRRAEYIQQTLASLPMLGTEWSTVKDNLLLRVSGDLPPSVASDYETVFNTGSTSNTVTTMAPISKEVLEERAHKLDLLASQGNAAEAYEFYSQRCKSKFGSLDNYKIFLDEWLKGRNPQYSGATAKVNGSSAQVVSIDNDPNAPASAMNPRTWTFIDGTWQFDNC